MVPTARCGSWQSMRPTNPHFVKPWRIMRLNESRSREPWKGANGQVVIFDYDLDGRLQPRGMPGAKDTSRAAMPEITTESLQRELSERACDARTEALVRLDASTVSKTTAVRAPTDNTPQTSLLVFVVILRLGEVAGQAERPAGQRQSPGSRQPTPKEKRTRLVIVSDVSAKVEEALFGNRCEYLRPEWSARVGAEATHGQRNDADDRLALV